MWRFKHQQLKTQGVDLRYGNPELLEITDRRLLSGKTLMTYNGLAEPNISVLFDFVACFALARSDRDGARPYAQEILDVLKEKQMIEEFLNDRNLEWDESGRSDERYVEEIIDSTME